MDFAAILATLPAAAGDRLVLTDAAGAEVGVVRNAPGSAGSFRVYAYLLARHGAIDAAAAAEGLAIFAEHAQDAAQHPGKHPNVDRLIAILRTGEPLAARLA